MVKYGFGRVILVKGIMERRRRGESVGWVGREVGRLRGWSRRAVRRRRREVRGSSEVVSEVSVRIAVFV